MSRDLSWLIGTPKGRAQAYSAAIILIFVIGAIYYFLNGDITWAALSLLAGALMGAALYHDYRQRFST